MKLFPKTAWCWLALGLGACAGMGKPPQGAGAQLSAQENASLERIRHKVNGLVVWSSSRFGNAL